MASLRVRRVSVRELTRAQIDQMWGLYEAGYEHVNRAAFDRDLAAKDFVLLGTDAGAIVGFCAVVIFQHEHEGRMVGFYYTGDTVFHPRYWGQKGLHWATLREWIRWKLRHPRTPLYWYLICSGHRTYLALVRNFPTYWPRHDRPTPDLARRLLDGIGRRRFGDLWHPERGVVSTGGIQPLFRPSLSPLDPAVRTLPEVDWFLRTNPGYARGDELAMIALVDAEAIRWMTRRWLARPLRRLVKRARRAIGRAA